MYKKNTIKILKICLIIFAVFIILTGISVAKKHKYKEKLAEAEPSYSAGIAESSQIEASQKQKLTEQSSLEERYSSEKIAISQKIVTLQSKISKYSQENTDEEEQ